MKNKIMKKSVALCILLSMLLSSIFNIVYATTEISEAYIEDRGECGYHLQYYNEKRGVWSYIICHYVVFNKDGVDHPAYCLQQDLHGVGDEDNYTVDVEKTLEDTRIWRTIINGYPYKSPSEMGVENEMDAFVAVKQAVYCILYDWNPYERYRGGDERGTKIANAICNLVEIGRNGNQTQYTNGISLEKVGENANDGDYYSIEYKANCGVETQSYSITSTTGLTNGTQITDLNNNIKTTFAGGENLKVRIPKNEISSEISGVIEIQARAKVYPVFYGKTRIAGTQDYALTYDAYSLVTGQGTLNVKANTGKILINKTDDETKEPIGGVKFELTDKNGNVVKTATTNINGKAEFTSLNPGDYILKEIETNKNYILNNKQFDVNVKYNETTTVDITNEHKKGQIKVIKVDLDNNEVKLEGVEFKVYDENKNVVDTIVTDKEGTATTKKLRANQKYTVQETNTLQNYILDDKPQTVELKAEQITTLTFENELKKGQIRIIKVDKDFNEIKLKGVEFKIYNEENELVDTLVTNENGEATSKRLRIDKKYTIEETKTLQNYTLNETPQTITLTQDQITDVKFENEYKKGNLKIYKVDKDNHKVTLGNVTFDLYSEEFQKVIGSYTTNVNGEIEINNLRIGNYKLIETNTGKWYNLADDTEVKIEWNKTEETTIENELQKGQIKVIKIDKDNHEVKLKGVKFDVLDEKGNSLETITTNEKGEAYTSRYAIRDYSKLTIREKETLNEYVLNDKPETVVLQANQIKTITFENELKKGQIKIIKVDLDNNEVKLQGVEFNVLDDSGKVVDKLITDKNGEAVSNRLRIDKKYTVQETKTLQNYVLTEETQKITLKQDEISNLTFENEKKKGQVKVIKIDKDENEVKLKGVEFKVYDENNEVVDTIVTDENGEATTKRLPIDQKYRVQESKTLDNYVLTEEPQTVVLQQDQITDLQFENEKIKGYFSITKYSSDDNKYSGLAKGVKLAGAEFEIYDSENNKVDTVVTDESGFAKSKELLKGKYTLKEVKAPLYYVVNKNTFETEIINHQETVNVDITDDNVDIDVEVEKTGFIETQSKDEIYYDFKNIKNNSNVYLDTFNWQDSLPTNAVRITKIFTGIWNQDLQYSVWYKTNMNDYKMVRENLNTNTNYEIDLQDVDLQDGEYITDYEFRFGKVDIGFMEVETPRIYCKVLDNLPNGFKFTNKTKVYGTYFEKYAEDEDNWTTVVYDKDIQLSKLPRTGE